MTIKEIIDKTDILCYNIKVAAATMDRKDELFELRQQLKEIQSNCPHVSQEYNWAIVNDMCPYCKGSIYSKEDKV